jgi:hypothetical protein
MGVWMAIMVANGIAAEDARMLGVAHEIKAWQPEFGIAEIRRDLVNNDYGIKVGEEAKWYYSGAGFVDDRYPSSLDPGATSAAIRAMGLSGIFGLNY